MIALPQTVLSSTLYGNSVFVVRTEGEGDAAKQTVEQVFVKAGRRSLGLVEIAEGLTAGDEVVTAGQNRLTGGARGGGRQHGQPGRRRRSRPRRTRRGGRCISPRSSSAGPVLSTVLAAFILLLGFQGIVNLPVRQYPEVEETVVTITTIYAGAQPDLIQGFITAPIAAAVATTENIDYVTSQSHAVGQRGQRAHEARLRSRRGADRGAVQGAERARPAAGRGRGPDHRQGHRLRTSR